MARPSSYDPEFAKQAEKLCTLGATDAELADFFEISVSTIYRWANAYKEFCDALKAGKEACDERVVRSLYNRAVGYTFDSEKIVVVDKKVERVAIKEHVAPDTTAQIFWLKNRRRDEWRDRQDHTMAGPNGGPIEVKDVSDTDRAAALLAFMAKTKGG